MHNKLVNIISILHQTTTAVRIEQITGIGEYHFNFTSNHNMLIYCS